MIHIRQEASQDTAKVEALYDLCFLPGREALSSYRLREGVPKQKKLCLVAHDENKVLVGAIRYWAVMIGPACALLLGPIAVHPTRQSEGIAGMLIKTSLDRASQSGWQRVLLVGDAPYYKKFGFQKLLGIQMPPPTNPNRVLGLSLTPDAWAGIQGAVEQAKP